VTLPTVFYDTARLALDCICEQMESLTDELAEDGIVYGCPCRSYVSLAAPAFDNCCGSCGQDEIPGQLTVYIADTFPSDAFPSTSVAIDPCKAAVHVISLVTTVVRCVPSVDDNGNAPDPEAIEAAARIAAIDMYAVTKALTCCLTQEPLPGKRKRRVQIASAGTAAVPESGGCGAIEIRALVEAANVCSCPENGS